MKIKDLLRPSKGEPENNGPTTAEEPTKRGSRNKLCNGDLCKLVQRFDIPAEGDLQRQFFNYLFDNGSGNGIAIGKKGEILKRHRCPLCRLVSSSVRGGSYADASDESPCYFRHDGTQDEQYCLKIHPPDRSGEKIMMALAERIVVVDRSDKPNSRAGRIVEPQLDYEKVKRWVDLCVSAHDGVCSLSDNARVVRSGMPSKLRVIDVESMCLTDIDWRDKYIALSYVWGNVVQVKLHMSDLQEFYTPRSLKQHRYRMPKTIRDAFIFTSCVGLRYLWIDALCLIQDSEADIKKGVLNMDIVYESAYVTVIAANGDSADAGLPGVGNTARFVKQRIEELKPGLELMQVHSLDEHLNPSVWATRGWVLQEQYLSRRMITFVNDQAYFRCRQRIWSDDLWFDQDPEWQETSSWTRNLVNLAGETMDTEDITGAPHDYLFLTLDRFSRRNLSNEDDAINAMSGILQRVANKANTTMIYGLPVDLFPLTFVFYFHQFESSVRRPMFPSWSWAGWKGSPKWCAFENLNIHETRGDIFRALERAFFYAWIHDSTKEPKNRTKTVWDAKRLDFESSTRDLELPKRGRLEVDTARIISLMSLKPNSLLSVAAVAVRLSLRKSRKGDGNENFGVRAGVLQCREGHECGMPT